MTAARRPRKAKAFTVRTAVKWIAAGLLLSVGVASLGLLTETSGGQPSQHVSDDHLSEWLSYIIGYALALLLTFAAFGFVYWKVFTGWSLPLAIGFLALIQIVVHFRFFLHINLSTQKRDDLHMILFSSLILLIMIGGTIWILTNLAQRMM